MTRIVGYLEGANGPLNGRLYVKAGGAFIGAPAKDLSFKVEGGIVDVELPPCPPSMPYFVDWKDTGDISRLKYVERWRVPSVEEVSLDELRGFHGRQTKRAGRAQGLDNAVWKAEAQEAREKADRLEKDNARLMHRLSAAEARAAAANGKLASTTSEVTRLKQRLQDAAEPVVNVEEKIIERQVMPSEARQALAEVKQELVLLHRENEKLKEQIEESVELSTHFSNLHGEIDRLRNENQRLLHRIEELKQPRRSVSSLRQEMIANLDKLIDG